MSDEEDFAYMTMDSIDAADEEDDEEEEEEEDGIQFSGGEEEDHAVGGMRDHRLTTYQTLTPDMISKKMFELIDEVNVVFQVHLCM